MDEDASGRMVVKEGRTEKVRVIFHPRMTLRFHEAASRTKVVRRWKSVCLITDKSLQGQQRLAGLCS